MAVHPEPRLVYILPSSVAISIALLFVDHFSGPRAAEGYSTAASIAIALLVACSSYSTINALHAFVAQHRFYGEDLMPTGTLDGLAWLRDNTPDAAVVATAPEQGVPFGWWVEGYARRATFVGAAKDFLNFPRERERAGVANRLFDAVDVLSAENLQAARALGIDYLVIPSGWDGLTPDDLALLLDSHADVVAYRNDALAVIEVPAANDAESSVR